MMVAGEGGHVTLPSASKEEDAIIEVLRKRWSHVSAERVLSGAGLVNLYEALCTIDGSAARALTPADVTRYTIGGTDLQCVKAFSSRIPGVGGRRPCADVRRHRRHIHRRRDTAGSRKRSRRLRSAKIRAKGTFRRHAGQNPTCLILEKSPALLGLAHLPLAVRRQILKLRNVGLRRRCGHLSIHHSADLTGREAAIAWDRGRPAPKLYR